MLVFYPVIDGQLHNILSKEITEAHTKSRSEEKDDPHSCTVKERALKIYACLRGGGGEGNEIGAEGG